MDKIYIESEWGTIVEIDVGALVRCASIPHSVCEHVSTNVSDHDHGQS